MSDLDRLLRDALQGSGQDYRPSDLAGARHTFMRRRRRMQITRFATAGVVVTAAIVGAFVFAGERTTLVDDKPPAQPVDSPDLAKLEGTIPVGDGPSGIAAGAGYIWVANRDDGTVSQIDPATHGVIHHPVGGAPEDLAEADNVVWVSHRELARWTRIDTKTGVVTGAVDLDATGDIQTTSTTHVDLDTFPFNCPGNPEAWCDLLEGEIVLYASGDDVTDNVLRESGTFSVSEAVAGLGIGPVSDVSAVGDDFWVVSPQDGTVSFIESAAQPNVSSSFDIGSFVRGDLVANGLDAWVVQSDKEQIVHVGESFVECTDSLDPGVNQERVEGCVTEEPRSGGVLRVEGTQFGLAYGEDSLWVVSTEGPEGPGALMRVDPYAMQVLHTVPIEGNPVDVEVDDGSVWVTDALNDIVLRFEADEFVPNPEEAPAEVVSPEPTGTVEPVDTEVTDSEDVAFFHSTDGDLYAEYWDGSTQRLTTTPELELDPHFTDIELHQRAGEGGLLFRRTDHPDTDGPINYIDITGRIDEQPIVRTAHTFAAGRGSDVAWSEITENKDGPQWRLTAGPLFSDVHDRVDLPFHYGPEAIEWDADNRHLFVATEEQEALKTTLFWLAPDSFPSFGEADVISAVQPNDQGEFTFAPVSSAPRSAHVLKACCASDRGIAVGTLELGLLTITEDNGAQSQYETVVASLEETEMGESILAELDGSLSTRNVFMSWAGPLDVEVDEDGNRSWAEGDQPAWFLGDGESLWLLDEPGNIDDLGDIGDGGVAIARR